MHEPVMLGEVLAYLDPQPGEVVLDLTVGAGGHAGAILDRIAPAGRLIGVDRDPAILEIGRKVLGSHEGASTLVEGLSQDLHAILDGLGVGRVNGVLLDLGVSSLQLDDPSRGFGFRSDGPLDMRMTQKTGETALDIIRRADAAELERILRELGEEPHARRIARRLASLARRRPPRTTGELAAFIESIAPHRGRIHPATRVFQALRLAVNDELGILERTLPAALERMAPGGRLVAISFHSLEDRLVKTFLRSEERGGRITRLTRKPVTPSPDEVRRNPRSRSAKLRAARKTGAVA